MEFSEGARMIGSRGIFVSLWGLSFCLPFVGIFFMGKGVKTGTRNVKYSSINVGRFIKCYKNISTERRKKL